MKVTFNPTQATLRVVLCDDVVTPKLSENLIWARFNGDPGNHRITKTNIGQTLMEVTKVTKLR